jgi:uncharacterized membrane protein
MYPHDDSTVRLDLQFHTSRFLRAGVAMTDNAGADDRSRGALRRLETLVDSVFALVLVILVADFPRPDDSQLSDVGAFLSANVGTLIGAVIGLIVVLIYWIQSNALCGNLERTNNLHSAIVVVQVFFVLTYLYMVGLALDLENPDSTVALAMQSSAAALIGIAAAIGWWYASYDGRLLAPNVDPADVDALRLRVLAEPMTALLTLGLAFVDATLWELGWLTYPLFARLLKRTRFFPNEK